MVRVRVRMRARARVDYGYGLRSGFEVRVGVRVKG